MASSLCFTNHLSLLTTLVSCQCSFVSEYNAEKIRFKFVLLFARCFKFDPKLSLIDLLSSDLSGNHRVVQHSENLNRGSILYISYVIDVRFDKSPAAETSYYCT
jgi:hypothetical protein